MDGNPRLIALLLCWSWETGTRRAICAPVLAHKVLMLEHGGSIPVPVWIRDEFIAPILHRGRCSGKEVAGRQAAADCGDSCRVPAMTGGHSGRSICLDCIDEGSPVALR